MARTLAYWDIRGLAQPIRLLLHYVGDTYEDKFYVQADDGTKRCWFDVKFSLGLEFPNLPYFIDGDIKITQTNAILKHIGRKHNLCGKTEAEQAQVDMMLDVTMDLRNALMRFVYQSERNDDVHAEYMKNLAETLSHFEKYMNGRNWFAGKEITVPDFHMYEMLDQHRLIEPSCLDDYPILKAFVDKFEALPPIKEYMSSDKFLKWPLNNKHAAYGSYKDKPAGI